jgi:hypothetical protein
MAVVMPDEALAQRLQAEQWEPLQRAYQESVEAILAYGADARVPGWIEEATRQFVRRSATIGKSADAQAVVKRVRTNQGEKSMATAWDDIQTLAQQSGRTVEEVCKVCRASIGSIGGTWPRA